MHSQVWAHRCVCSCGVPPGVSGAHTEPRPPRGPRRDALERERPWRGAPGVRGGVRPGACPGVLRAQWAGGCRVPPPGGAAGGGLPGRLRQSRLRFPLLPGRRSPTALRSAVGEGLGAGRAEAPVPAPSARGLWGRRGLGTSVRARRQRESGRGRGVRAPSLAVKGPRAACGTCRKGGDTRARNASPEPLHAAGHGHQRQSGRGRRKLGTVCWCGRCGFLRRER